MRTPRLILNADDFGASHAHNSAVIDAFRAGSLTSASLMMGQSGTEEAIALARAHPGLRIGLHLALSDAMPVMEPQMIPALVNDRGRFYPTESALFKASVTPKGRRQLRAEIAAQFSAFAASGLPFDHVNTHRHSHQIPTVAMMVFAEARRWNVTTSRIPWNAQQRWFADVVRKVRFHGLKAMIKPFGVTTFYTAIGRDWDAAILLAALEQPMVGVTELYFHPMVGRGTDLAALLDRRVLRRLQSLGRDRKVIVHA